MLMPDSIKRTSMLHAALSGRVCLTKLDIQSLCATLGLAKLPGATSEAEWIAHLCSAVFDSSSPDYDKLVAKAMQTPDNPEEMLAGSSGAGCVEEVAELVGEISERDIDDVADVKALKAAISNKLKQTLVD